jgi:hypothetical protein
MASIFYKLALVGIIGLIVFAVYMAMTGYANDVYPVDVSRGLLDRIMTSPEPATVLADLHKIQELLPEEGNPVWIFPTPSTDFTLIQRDLDAMIIAVEKIQTVPRDSSAFHTGMDAVGDRALVLQENLEDVTPYMYVSFINIVLSAVWIAGILAIFAVLKRKKEQLQTSDMSDGI